MLGLTLPKTSTLTINRNPQNSLFERVELVKLPNWITTTAEAPPGEDQSSLYLSFVGIYGFVSSVVPLVD